MSDPVRGHAMIINNGRFYRDDGSEITEATRHGSGIDYDNISTLFKDMGFVIARGERRWFDLTREVSITIFLDIGQPKIITLFTFQRKTYVT